MIIRKYILLECIVKQPGPGTKLSAPQSVSDTAALVTRSMPTFMPGEEPFIPAEG